MIEVKNVTKKYGDFTAVENIGFSVDDSSIYGIIGYNGAGKTTLLKTCAGIYKSENGEVLLDGESSFNSNHNRRNLFYIPDDLYFLPNAALKNMAKFYKGYYPSFSEKTFENLIKLFGLDASKRLHGFSKGMQRQAEIILALSCRPKYMLLDECFDGLDPQKRNISKQLLLEYMAESGCSMIISSHNLSEISNMSDHVGLINGKRLTLNYCIDDLTANYKKYRLIFEIEPNKSLFDFPEIKKVKIQNNAVILTAMGDSKEIMNKLKALHPVSAEVFGMTLEEIFLSEMEDESYDIKTIFEQ